MYYFEYGSQDATLYESSQSMNSGLDSVVEIRKDVNANASVIKVSRGLIQFDVTYISESIASGLMHSASFYLNMYDANPDNLNFDTTQTLLAYPVSQSWSMGVGSYSDTPITTEGVSWKYRNGENDGTQWISGSDDTGGAWYSGSGYEASQSYDIDSNDMRMDVTDIVNKWVDGTIPNNGFILKRSGSLGNSDVNTPEGDSNKYGNFSFFSRETNTIYQPKLEVEWDDSTWSTGSLDELTSGDLDDMTLYMKGLRVEYKESSKTKFRVVGKERFPTATWATTSDNLTVKYLPSGSSYYQIKDSHSGDVIMPYGTGSLLSCDSSGNYFNMWMNGLQSERFYDIEFKVVSGSGTVDETIQYFDGGHFKVVI
jgi:hypothetical protein